MLFKKQGFPEDEELVLCTVTAVQYHSVFAKLDEYGITGLIHISEVAPGRIRNIRDFVVEGKKVVCKVLRVNKEKGHIDLSLRRVNDSQKRMKLNQIKQEQLAERIVENVAKQSKKDFVKLYNQVTDKLFEKYPTLFAAFDDVANDKLKLDKFFDKTLSKELTENIKQRITPPEVKVAGNFKLISYAPNGVEVIKNILQKAETTKGKPTVKYKGAGIYGIIVKTDDYKKAEKILKEAVDGVLEHAKKEKVLAEFNRVAAE